jgi:hypothetical protein
VYLSGKVKNLLTEKKFASADEIPVEICQILEDVGSEEVNGVLANWKQRLQKCTTMNGECVG